MCPKHCTGDDSDAAALVCETDCQPVRMLRSFKRIFMWTLAPFEESYILSPRALPWPSCCCHLRIPAHAHNLECMGDHRNALKKRGGDRARRGTDGEMCCGVVLSI